MDEKTLTQAIEELRREYGVAGMSVAVTNEKEIIYSHGFGYENALRPEVPTHRDAMYKIASITKTFTSLAVLRLAENGILDINAPIKKYVPELCLKNKVAENSITLRDLLMHVGGMPGDGYLEEGSRDESTVYGNMLVLAKDFNIDHLPEERFYRYSTFGYDLIGCVAQRVTGFSFSELLDNCVLKPLGTQQTTFDYFVASTYPLSLPHKTTDGHPSVIHYQRINTVHNAGGGLYSDSSDLCRLARLFIRGGVTDSGECLLSKETFTDMTAKHIERSDALGSYYGLGVYSYPFNGRYTVGHTGNYTPYDSSFFVDPEGKLGVVTLINTSASELRYKIPELIFKTLI